MATDDLTRIASRAAIITSVPILIFLEVAFVLALAAFIIATSAVKQNHKLCDVLQQDSIIYIKESQFDRAAEARAETSPAPQTHMWFGLQLLNQELALNNASLCGFPKPPVQTVLPSPAPKGTK